MQSERRPFCFWTSFSWTPQTEAELRRKQVEAYFLTVFYFFYYINEKLCPNKPDESRNVRECESDSADQDFWNKRSQQLLLIVVPSGQQEKIKDDVILSAVCVHVCVRVRACVRLQFLCNKPAVR